MLTEPLNKYYTIISLLLVNHAVKLERLILVQVMYDIKILTGVYLPNLIEVKP